MQNAMTSALGYASQVEPKRASIRHWRDQTGGLRRSFLLYRDHWRIELPTRLVFLSSETRLRSSPLLRAAPAPKNKEPEP